ncbi:MAG: dephospho-CoA kinase [Acidimicrobiales bacterium]|jgi:dephospho-CoA kinase
MIVVGLTGGIGSGKSTVASMLVARGALLIDADEVAREVVEPGWPAHAKVVERFGDEVVAPDGSLNRQALAKIVFDDPVALAELEAIVHPAVRDEIATRLAAKASGDHLVVLDIPLLFEAGGIDQYGLSGVLVVDAPLDVVLERLVNLRHMARADAEARIANQAGRSERIAGADFVIMNMGTLDELEEMASRAFSWMAHLRDQDGASGS